MKLSKRCEHAIQAVVCLARDESSSYLRAREIADREGLPAKFLEAVLLRLRETGFLRSKVGARGGYRLARAPEEITLLEIIAAFQDETVSEELRAGTGTRGVLYARMWRAMVEGFEGLSLTAFAEMVDEQGVSSPARGRE